MVNLSERIEGFNHPVAIERWRSYLFDREYTVNNGRFTGVVMSMFSVGFLYGTLDVNIFYGLLWFLISEILFFINWYLKEVDIFEL